MASDHRAADSTLAAEHAALRAQYQAVQDRFAREVRAHDSERHAHAATAAQLALVRAAHPVPPVSHSTGWRGWLRAFLSRRPVLHTRLRRFSVRYPRVRQLPGRAARLMGRTLTLQWPRRIARQWNERRASAPLPAPAPPRFALRAIFPIEIAPPRSPGRRLVCVTHVLPHPPRAGNEYRIARMLPWLSAHGWEVLLVVCPPSSLQLDQERVRQTAAAFPNLIVCGRDGTLLHHLAGGGAMLEALAGREPRDFAAVLGERISGDEASRWTLTELREFCPDVLVELLLHIEQHFDPEILLAEYIFMTRPFPLLRPQLRKVIDTIDVFSNKPRKVEQFGIVDRYSMTQSEEASLLDRADLLIAIQPEEAADLRRLAPSVPVISVGVDFDMAGHGPPASAAVILLVASDNQINAKGLADFVRFAWPLVRRAVPDAELRVVGSLGEHAEVSSPGISILGRIDDIGAAYAQARVVINPAVAGTGLKVKTVEALSHARPIVLWPSGVEGIAPQARGMCHVARDWFDFAQHVIALLQSHDGPRDFAPSPQELIPHLAPDHVYAPLAQALLAPWSRGP